MQKYFFLIVFFSSFSLFGQDWSPNISLPQVAPARHHPVTFSLNGYGYLTTGTSPEGLNLDDFWKFDPFNGIWEEMSPFPGGPRSFSYGVSYNGKAYVGFGRNDFGPLSDLWEYDPTSNSWKELAKCPCSERTHPALVAANGHVYVGLGGGGGNKKDWFAYNIESGIWEQRADFPSFRRHHPFYFEIDDYAYVGMGHGEGIYNDLYKYDHLTDTWDAMANLPDQGRVAGTQFSYNGKGYVLSGDGEDHDHMEEGEFWEYDPELDSWTKLTPHLGIGSRWAPGSFMIDNTLYFVAGQENYVLKRDMMSYTFERNSTSIIEKPILTFDVFPNPTKEYIEFKNVDEIDELNIYSIEGNEMTDYVIDGARLEISNFNPGTYIIQIKSNDELRQAKFVKI